MNKELKDSKGASHACKSYSSFSGKHSSHTSLGTGDTQKCMGFGARVLHLLDPSLCCPFSHCSYRPILQILCSALCSEDRPLRTPLRDSLSWIHLPSGFWLIWEDGCHWPEANGRKKNRVFIPVGCWHFCTESLHSCQAVVSSICSTHCSFL